MFKKIQERFQHEWKWDRSALIVKIFLTIMLLIIIFAIISLFTSTTVKTTYFDAVVVDKVNDSYDTMVPIKVNGSTTYVPQTKNRYIIIFDNFSVTVEAEKYYAIKVGSIVRVAHRVRVDDETNRVVIESYWLAGPGE